MFLKPYPLSGDSFFEFGLFHTSLLIRSCIPIDGWLPRPTRPPQMKQRSSMALSVATKRGKQIASFSEGSNKIFHKNV